MGLLPHLHRHEHRHLRLDQQALAHLPPPRKQQALAQPVPRRDMANPNTRLVRFPDNAQLVCRAPLPPPLATGDDLHHAVHPHTSTATLTSDLRRQEDYAQAALAGRILDEFTRECLAIRVARKLGSADVIDVLADLFIARGTPGHVRSDNGPEFIATTVKGWISGVGAKTAFIEPGRPWENGYVESFNGKLRDELLNAEVFITLFEARVLIEQWRVHYNRVRPHSSLGYRPPAPEVVVSGMPMPSGRSGPTGAHQPPAAVLH